MAETLILPPKVETLVVRELAARLPGVDVRGRRDGAPAHRQIQVRKTGGSEVTPRHERAQVTVHAWGVAPDDEDGAEDLAADALAAIRAADFAGWMDVSPASGLTLFAAPYPNPDPTTGCARYTFTFTILLHNTIQS
jgi:hypothetical protein